MTVRDLIEFLTMCNPDSIVWTYGGESGGYSPLQNDDIAVNEDGVYL